MGPIGPNSKASLDAAKQETNDGLQKQAQAGPSSKGKGKAGRITEAGRGLNLMPSSQAVKKKDQAVDGTFRVYAMVANMLGVEHDVRRICLPLHSHYN
jgi:hypothetical protein